MPLSRARFNLQFPSVRDVNPQLSIVPVVSLFYFTDKRGSLASLDFDCLPFSPNRFFFVFDSGTKTLRGDHAHKACTQLLVSLSGWTDIAVESPSRETMFLKLDSVSLGVIIPPRFWASQVSRSHGSVLGVFASHAYDESDYIRSYDQWSASCPT